jgi:hypothetical protein
MGAPTSEVSYVLATTRRKAHEVHKGRVAAWGGEHEEILLNIRCQHIMYRHQLTYVSHRWEDHIRMGLGEIVCQNVKSTGWLLLGFHEHC